MISQRAARPSGSVEKLRQLSLSNLRGIDETQAPTDPYSVDRSINLVNNIDGSLTVRKPLLIKRNWTQFVSVYFDPQALVSKVLTLYSEKDVGILFKVSNSNYFAIYDTVHELFYPIKLKWIGDDGTEHIASLTTSSEDSNLKKFAAVLDGFLDIENCTVVHASTSTVLGNCTVNLNSKTFEEAGKHYPLQNVHLYDTSLDADGNTAVVRPRYLNLNKSTVDTVDTWYIQVSPSNTSELEASDAGYVHPLNTSTDDMYSLQDPSASTVPYALGIVPYVPTTLRADGAVFVSSEDAPIGSPPPQLSGVTHVHDGSLVKLESGVNNKFDEDFAGTSDGSAQVSFTIVPYAKATAFTDETGAIDCEMKVTVSVQLAISTRDKLLDEGYSHIDIRSVFCTVNLIYKVGSATGLLLDNAMKYSLPQYHIDLNSPSIVGDKYVTFTICSTEPVSNSHFIQKYGMSKGFQVTTIYLKAGLSWEVGYTHTVEQVPLDVHSFTKSLKKTRFRGINSAPNELEFPIVFKAFCNIPETKNAGVYATWLYTTDGITWKSIFSNTAQKHSDGTSYVDYTFEGAVNLSGRSEDPISDVALPNLTEEEKEEAASRKYDYFYLPFEKTGWRFDSNKESYVKVDDTSKTEFRVDVLKISKNFFKKVFTNATFRFKIVLADDAHNIVATYSQHDYTLMHTLEGEIWHSDFGNSALGEKLYFNKKIFSYGDVSFGANVFVTNAGELVTPFANTIDVSAAEDSTITTVVPWKDYLFISTPQALYLASQVENGYLTKTVNASIGVPIADCKCAVPTLNGVLFKSESKVYLMYPNLYAGDDSIANITTVSDPIGALLEECASNANVSFAFGTESEYVLMLSDTDSNTTCFKYNYNTKRWNCTRYPISVESCFTHSLTDVRLFGKNSVGDYCEYYFDKTFKEAYEIELNGVRYGDILSESKAGIVADVQTYLLGDASAITVTPIAFELDTGQKSDQILTKKQFVETKIVLSTDSHAPAIDMQCTVHVGGNASIVVKDVSTDSAFWKKETGGMVLNTSGTGFGNADAKNVLRQIVLRYSGKGNSIRHIITGKSLSNFSLYETYVRYKLLNVKQ